jgi:hypothetical protein
MHQTSSEKGIWRSLYTIGAIAALVQLAAILSYTIVVFVFGTQLASAQEYFAVHQTNRLMVLLRGDFPLLFLIVPYFATFPAMFLSLRRTDPVAAFFATLFTFVAVTVCIGTESSFALMNLGDRYAAAASDAVRAQLVAAGQAVIASDMWNSSGAYISGILMQGGGVIVSLAMLRSRDFNKVTAIAGLLGNALDLAQHMLHPFAPSISAPIQMAMGPFYLVWFPMLARDLFRLAKQQ